MKRPILLTLLLLCLGILPASAQQLTQTIRGTVTDVDTKEALIGAEVFIVGSDPLIGTTADLDGNYVLENVPLGRQTVQCNYVGYLPFTRDNIQLNSAREYRLEISLKAGVELSEVVVNAYNRNEAVNELSVASIRRIDPEELQYHAATANDPGRLVQGFPGVQPSRDNRSDIVIRGNSSAGLLWRLEGIDIPNPNHFARRGSSGGGITVFSASLLGSSDFSVGAFPAEYGNAFSGVFDMKFRNGNMHQRQNTIRVGLLGLDYATEGPIKKEKSSYLANFRYSTLGILNAAGLHLVGPRTDNNFQDFSFKIFSKGTKSQFSFWGIGGNSIEKFRAEDMPWTTYSDYTAYKFTTKMGAVGTSWNYLIDNRSFIQVNAGLMGQDVFVQDDTLNTEEQHFTLTEESYKTNQVVVNAFYKRTFNPKLNFKIGSTFTSMGYDLGEKKWDKSQQTYQTLIDGKSADGSRGLMQQYYVQFSYRPVEKLVVNFGGHALLTNVGAPDSPTNSSVEPRLALKYDFSKRSSLALAYGLHSRMLPLGSYFTRLADGETPNLDLGLIKASHFVAAFNQLIGANLNFHAEAYWQTLKNVPVSVSPGRIYWLLNDVQGFATEALTAEGTGRNIGLDLYLEKFFHQGTFFILSTSIFNSTFQVPNDSKRYSTQYDSRYSLTFTGGKTWELNPNTFLESSLRVLFNGGNPINPLAKGYETIDGDDPVLDESNPYSDRVAPYLRPDVRVALRKNKAKTAYWLALDIQNIINRRNEDSIDYEFDGDTGRWDHRLQSSLTPLLTFQLDF